MACIGDAITYTCSVATFSHTWRILSFGVDVDITRNRNFSDSRFTIVVARDPGSDNPIITELSVIAFDGLNGTAIHCSDANTIVTDTQETIAMVFGKFAIHHGSSSSLLRRLF